MWIEANFGDCRISFKQENVRSYWEDGSNLTRIQLDRVKDTEEFTINMSYDEFKKIMAKDDKLEDFKRAWANNTVQGTIVAPLGSGKTGALDLSNTDTIGYSPIQFNNEKAEALSLFGNEDIEKKKEHPYFQIGEITPDTILNQYVSFTEAFQPGNWKLKKGWVTKINSYQGGKVITADIRADDEWKGARGTVVDLSEIIEVLPYKEQPDNG